MATTISYHILLGNFDPLPLDFYGLRLFMPSIQDNPSLSELGHRKDTHLLFLKQNP